MDREIIVCIDNTGSAELTVGKKYSYIIKDNKYNQYFLADDHGNIRAFNVSKFKEISELREEKLKNLLDGTEG